MEIHERTWLESKSQDKRKMKKTKRKPTGKPSDARQTRRTTTRSSKGNVSARFGELFYQIRKSTGQRGCEIWGTLLPNTLKTRDKGHHGGQSTATCVRDSGNSFTKYSQSTEGRLKSKLKQISKMAELDGTHWSGRKPNAKLVQGAKGGPREGVQVKKNWDHQG